VDIENASDVGGGFDVAFTQPGGWMQYTVNVANSGVYSVERASKHSRVMVVFSTLSLTALIKLTMTEIMTVMMETGA